MALSHGVVRAWERFRRYIRATSERMNKMNGWEAA
jgi:hypothetical protein